MRRPNRNGYKAGGLVHGLNRVEGQGAWLVAALLQLKLFVQYACCAWSGSCYPLRFLTLSRSCYHVKHSGHV